MLYNSTFRNESRPQNTATVVILSERQTNHIVYGDENGGGHLHGQNIPCKTEFPKNWAADEVIETVQKLAAKDNANWRKEPNGYYVSEQFYEDLNIRVVMDPERKQVITAYPVNLPRNPCPANDR